MPTITVKQKPTPSRIRATRGALTNIALNRARFADRWVPGYRRALHRVLAAYDRRVASAMAYGMPFPNDEEKQLHNDLVRVKNHWVPQVVESGYNLAGPEVGEVDQKAGKSSQDWSGKAENAAAAAAAGGEDGGVIIGGTSPRNLAAKEKAIRSNEFLLQGDFKNINKWVASTSLSESASKANRLAAVWQDAMSSRDPKTGVAWTPAQMSKAILERGLADSEWRADMLARTGTVWSMNEGAQQRYRSAGVTVQEWIASIDDITCPFCLTMHNTVVGVGQPFWPDGTPMSVNTGDKVVSLNTKGATEHPPLHPNCRCTIVPVVRTQSVTERSTRRLAGQAELRKRREQQAAEKAARGARKQRTTKKPVQPTSVRPAESVPAPIPKQAIRPQAPPPRSIRERILIDDPVRDPKIQDAIERTFQRLERRKIAIDNVTIRVTKDPSKFLTNEAVAEFNAGTNTVTINANNPIWKNPLRSARASRKAKFWSEGSPEHAIMHELGHKRHLTNVGPTNWRALKLTREQKAIIRKDVSRYAATDTREFVAEVDAGLNAGRTYSSWIMARYRVWGGF